MFLIYSRSSAQWMARINSAGRWQMSAGFLGRLSHSWTRNRKSKLSACSQFIRIWFASQIITWMKWLGANVSKTHHWRKFVRSLANLMTPKLRTSVCICLQTSSSMQPTSKLRCLLRFNLTLKARPSSSGSLSSTKTIVDSQSSTSLYSSRRCSAASSKSSSSNCLTIFWTA